MSTNMSPSRIDTLLPRLACPFCRRPIRRLNDGLSCSRCGAVYPIYHGRPCLLQGISGTPRLIPVEHISHQPPQEILDWLKGLDGWALNLGAGGTITKLSNCIELECSIFRHTDVVADAHHLPFPDHCFDGVVSFNTFEHLIDPYRAASEIRRVLKPGGRLVVHTAFLQPVHEAPHHFYNTTEYGLRNWFRDFDHIDITSVSQPAHVLAWLSADLLRAVEVMHGPEARARLAATTLDNWRSVREDSSQRIQPHFQLLDQLPQEVQRRYAATLRIEAINQSTRARAKPPRYVALAARHISAIRSWLGRFASTR